MAAFDLEAAARRAGSVFGPEGVVRYASNRPTYTAFGDLLNDALRTSVPAERLRRADLPPATVLRATLLGVPPVVVGGGLYELEGGAVVEEADAGRIVEGFAVPLGFVSLLFLVVLVGASPMTTNVIEEKQLRIAEVLLAGVRPFDLMLGKLLGGVGVALTLAIVYVGGAYGLAWYYGLAGYVRPGVLGWFVLFVVIAALLFGALFAAAGAAVTTVKEAQALISPVMIVLAVPLAAFRPVINDPDGPVALALGFFPLTAPVVTVMRIGVPPGIPAWQALLAAASALLGTLAAVWAAGRVFRIGMLATGRAPTPRELLGWIVRG